MDEFKRTARRDVHGREARVCVCARLRRRRSRGEANTSIYLPPACYCAVLARLRRWTRFWPQVRHASPTAAHPSPPPPPGQHARVIGRVRVIPPDAAPSSMRLLVALIYAVYQFTSSSCSVPRNTPLAGPPDPCVTPRWHGPLLPRRPREPRRPPTASCAMHCTPLVQDLQGHAPHLRLQAPTRPERTRCSHEGIDTQPAHGQVSVAQ